MYTQEERERDTDEDTKQDRTHDKGDVWRSGVGKTRVWTERRSVCNEEKREDG